MIVRPPMMSAQSPPAASARLAIALSLIFRVSGSATISASSSRSFQCLPRRRATNANGNLSRLSTWSWLTWTPPAIGASLNAPGSGTIGSGSGRAAKSGTRKIGDPLSPSARGARGARPTAARGASSRGDRGPSAGSGAGCGAGSATGAGGALRPARPAASASRLACCCSGVRASQLARPAALSFALVSSDGRRPPPAVVERMVVMRGLPRGW